MAPISREMEQGAVVATTKATKLMKQFLATEKILLTTPKVEEPDLPSRIFHPVVAIKDKVEDIVEEIGDAEEGSSVAFVMIVVLMFFLCIAIFVLYFKWFMKSEHFERRKRGNRSSYSEMNDHTEH